MRQQDVQGENQEPDCVVPAVVEISNRGTDGYVAIDAVQFLPLQPALGPASPPEE